jgi:hypothetical protein
MSKFHEGSPPTRLRQRGEGRFCIDCHYPLQGLNSPGRCPECGRDFDFTQMFSYSVDPEPPTFFQRLFGRRMLALYGAVSLEIVGIWMLKTGFFCGLKVFLLLWLLGVLWQAFIALGLDQSLENVVPFVSSGIVLGMLATLPLSLGIPIVHGSFLGAICGLFLYQLKSAGWLD